GLALVFLGPGFGLGEGPVVDRHVMALGGEMPRHRETHHAETEKRHLRHLNPPKFRRPEHRAAGRWLRLPRGSAAGRAARRAGRAPNRALPAPGWRDPW